MCDYRSQTLNHTVKGPAPQAEAAADPFFTVDFV
jgi:hypothetical protein